jgi:signal transduction histidine kinase
MSQTEPTSSANLVCPQCRSIVQPEDITCSICGVDLALATVLAEREVLAFTPARASAPYVSDVILPRFGEYLLRNGYILEPQLHTALDRQRELAAQGVKQTIGQVLLGMGAVTRVQLDVASIQQTQELQEAVSAQNRQLEESVAKNKEALRQAMQRLSEVSQLKANFVGTITHELRTPLSHIQGYRDLLARGVLGSLTPDQKDALNVISRATEKLDGLITDLIRFASTAKSGMALRQTVATPNDLLERVLEVSAPKAAEDNIALNAEIPARLPPTLADWEQIYWVVFQLLDNAIKFTPDNGSVTLAAEVRGPHLRLVVSDTGIGIPTDRIEELFEPFHQLDGSDIRRYGGMGLGLALVRRIVEAHQARIEVQSEVGRGSTFAFELPLAE